MAKNSKMWRFFFGVVLLGAIGTFGYREVAQERALSNQPSLETQTASAIATSQSRPLSSEESLTQQAIQKLNGFSTDSRYFIHLESWRDTGAGISQATLQVINLSSNTCVEKGCLQTSYGEADANLSLQVAENQLLQQTQTLRQTLNLTQPIAGTTLPVISRSRTENGYETLTVQLRNGRPLQLRLKQTKEASTFAGGTVEKDRTAIELTAVYEGKEYRISNPNKWHDWVLNVSIREVRQSPDGQRIAVLLTSEERAFEGSLGRTIIQSLELPTQ